MKICQNQHAPVCFDADFDCPACVIRASLQQKIEEVRKELHKQQYQLLYLEASLIEMTAIVKNAKREIKGE